MRTIKATVSFDLGQNYRDAPKSKKAKQKK